MLFGLLRRGSTGRPVLQLQRALNYHFAARLAVLVEDAVFGPKTEGRVKEFQRRNRLVPDAIVGPLTRAKLYDIAAAPIRFKFQREKMAAGLSMRSGARASAAPASPFQRFQRPELVGEGPATEPEQRRVVILDWGQTFTFQPLAKPDEGEHTLKTDLKFALKNNGEDEDIIGRLQLDLPPGQQTLGLWQMKAELEHPVGRVPLLGPLEANVFLNQSFQLSPVQFGVGAGVRLGLRILGDKVGIFAQGDLKAQYTPEEKKGELQPSASGVIELKF